MGRTRLAEQIRGIFATISEAARRNLPVEQVAAERCEQQGMSRRAFLRSAAAAGAAVAMPRLRLPLMQEATAPRIVVVGAGLAGLTAAYRLQQKGYRADVFEAASRVGGRCWSNRSVFDQDQVIEHGGELIDSSHQAIKQLAKELGLRLDNLDRAMQNDTEELFHFDGAPYTYHEATDDIKAIWQKIHRDVSQASYPTLYNSYTERGLQLDQLSIIDWIEESIPGGMSTRLGKLLEVAYTLYYGGEASDQSSLNLLYMMGYRGQGNLRLYGPSDERYHVQGGNKQIPERLAAALADQLHLGSALVAIRQDSGGSYTLTFDTDGATHEVTADKVVLALPFSVMRSAVDYRQAGFRPLKEMAIREQGMGTNVKLQLQFHGRFWEEQGCNGETYSDTGYQSTWEVTRAQPGTAGILVNFTGGTYGATMNRGSIPSRAEQFLAQLEPVLPGITGEWNGRVSMDYWPGYRWTKGSYSYWRVGQYTRFAGVEGEREGNCHFAGEHTSVDFQGFLNGAVESGERAADEILADLK